MNSTDVEVRYYEPPGKPLAIKGAIINPACLHDRPLLQIVGSTRLLDLAEQRHGLKRAYGMTLDLD